MTHRNRLEDLVPRPNLGAEHDSCAIIANVRKRGMASHGNLKRTMEALMKMGHRSGEVNGEGDGCGVLTDIPRALWAKKLALKGFQRTLAQDERFVVGHLLISPSERANALALMDTLARRVAEAGLDLMLMQRGEVESEALGRQARKEEPDFWQIAALSVEGDPEEANRRLFRLQLAMERELPVHFASFSADSVVYKVRGTVEVLRRYYPDLRNPEFLSAITIGHNRYSTNTGSTFERVQPFSLLGHNGEINTIRKLREEARMIGVQLVEDGSDSQDLDRLISSLIHQHGLSLLEAVEVVLPPIINEIKQFPAPIQDMYMYLRQAWGPFTQGPVGLVSRYGDECIFAVDALGLRPLWFGETEKEFFFTSERGIIPLENMVRSPKPLAPGEKVGVLVHRERRVEVLEHHRLQQRVLQLLRDRFPLEDSHRFISCGGPLGQDDGAAGDARPLGPNVSQTQLTAAFGWDAEDLDLVKVTAATGKEPIGSLGFDGPLAALSKERQNLADYFKESVAVVTNPAIDREREVEHFSTRVVIGVRPALNGEGEAREDFIPSGKRVELMVPLLLGGDRVEPLLPLEERRRVAHDLGTFLLEDLVAEFEDDGEKDPPSGVRFISTTYQKGEHLREAVRRLTAEAVEAVQAGAHLLVLDDGQAFTDGRRWIDPHLAVAAVDRALREAPSRHGWGNLRRQAGVVLRSGAIRNLHDVVLALGMGANVLNPYLMLEVACGPNPDATLLRQLGEALRVGIEKVISTLGIHEMRGYSRLFSSIGLSRELSELLETQNFCGSDQVGLTWERLEERAEERYRVGSGEREGVPARTYRLTPRLWKAVQAVAERKEPYSSYAEKLLALEQENPVALRHLLAISPRGAKTVPPRDVDISVGTYRFPFIIASMSFGSQNEMAFRAYAEAARRLDIIALNGEGGEIEDMIGKYRRNRGQQLASGRFGVNIELANSSDLWEIKVGQGAKPGEGGHLPGAKVSSKVAAARHARPGTGLISPSNNHDVYSIEDLAQLIEELKTTNPRAKVAVKVPVVPGIGTIAVGIAKAGADIISLSGYDGGTGAARKHAIRHVGLPAEIGVRLAHEALVQSGLRDRTEIWCDGGMRSALDVLKMILLGANRVGFGTMAMTIIGCTACRSCHTDTCHKGICTQIDTREEAARRGLKRFDPRDYEEAVRTLTSFFTAMGEELRRLTSELGFRASQDLVGRSDLLMQVAARDRLDLAELLSTIEWTNHPDREAQKAARRIRRPRNSLTRLVSDLVVELMDQGEESIAYDDDKVSSTDRAFGTYLSGELTRARAEKRYRFPGTATLSLYGGSVAGNGLAAFNTEGVEMVVEGGGQDGVGKMSLGGKVVILKGTNHEGERVDGSVGKGLAYGAQGGLFIVQGDADSRAGIRLSGADVVIGGELKRPVDDLTGNVAAKANIKGFAFEYMTDGRAVVLGDPGPWICSGMTGGTVYQRLRPEMGLDEAAIRRRIAKGARIDILPLDKVDAESVRELLGHYHKELIDSNQEEEAGRVMADILGCEQHFVKLVPQRETNQSGATASTGLLDPVGAD